MPQTVQIDLAAIPPEVGQGLGRTCAEMFQRLTSTPEGRAKLDAWKAAHPHKKGDPA